MTRLEENVEKNGLRIRLDVPGDGNCFFACISDQMLRLEQLDGQSHVITPTELRNRLYNFLNNLVRLYMTNIA
jgi:hypothetical protein